MYYNSVINVFNFNVGMRICVYLFVIKCFEFINFMCIVFIIKILGKLFFYIYFIKKIVGYYFVFENFMIYLLLLGIMLLKWNKGVMFVVG